MRSPKIIEKEKVNKMKKRKCSECKRVKKISRFMQDHHRTCYLDICAPCYFLSRKEYYAGLVAKQIAKDIYKEGIKKSKRLERDKIDLKIESFENRGDNVKGVQNVVFTITLKTLEGMKFLTPTFELSPPSAPDNYVDKSQSKMTKTKSKYEDVVIV